MTVQEIIEDVYEALGEKTDLDPTTPGGLATLLRAFNQSVQRVASWKDPSSNRYLRFPELRGEYTFQVEQPTGTWSVASTALPTEGETSFTAPTALATYASGSVIELNGSYLYCFHVNGNTVYTKEAVPSGLTDGFTWNVYRKSVYVGKTTGADPNDIDVVGDTSNPVPATFIDVMRLWDLTGDVALERGPKGNDYLKMDYTIGTPKRWTKLGNVVFFNTHLFETKWFKMEYYKTPKQVTALDGELELPENLHQAVVLAMLEWGYQRSGETTEKYSTKQDLKEFFRSLKSTQDMFEDVQDQDGGVLFL